MQQSAALTADRTIPCCGDLVSPIIASILLQSQVLFPWLWKLVPVLTWLISILWHLREKRERSYNCNWLSLHFSKSLFSIYNNDTEKNKLMARDLATEAMEILLLVHNMQFKTKNYNAKTQQTMIEVLNKEEIPGYL